MGARGPKPGTGPVTAWIVQAFQSGDKNRFEAAMGCPYRETSFQVGFTKLVQRNYLVATAVERAGKGNRPGTVYTLNKEIGFASSSDPRIQAASARTNPTRTLENAFHGIVGARLAKAQ